MPLAALWAAGVYWLLTGIVVGLDYGSESAKLDRGVHTDTFSPLAFARLASLPLSAAQPTATYPQPDFHEGPYRSVIVHAVHGYLAALALQGLLIGVLAAVAVAGRAAWTRRASRSR